MNDQNTKTRSPEEMLAAKLHEGAKHLNLLFRTAAASGLVINGTFSRSRYHGDRADSSVLRIRVLKEVGELTGGDFVDAAEASDFQRGQSRDR